MILAYILLSGMAATSGRARPRALHGRAAARPASVLLGFRTRLDHALAAVETVGRDAMTQMRFSGLGIDRQRRLGNRIVRAVHAALGGSLATLLNWHWSRSPESLFRS